MILVTLVTLDFGILERHPPFSVLPAELNIESDSAQVGREPTNLS